jgi:hypothetical protein
MAKPRLVNHDFHESLNATVLDYMLARIFLVMHVPEPGAAVTLAKTTATVSFLSDSAMEDVKPKMLKDSLRNLTK